MSNKLLGLITIGSLFVAFKERRRAKHLQAKMMELSTEIDGLECHLKDIGILKEEPVVKESNEESAQTLLFFIPCNGDKMVIFKFNLQAQK